jgi:hypothetical protein
MRDTLPRLKTLEEIEKTGVPGLIEVLREEAWMYTVRPVRLYGLAQGLQPSRLKPPSASCRLFAVGPPEHGTLPCTPLARRGDGHRGRPTAWVAGRAGRGRPRHAT